MRLTVTAMISLVALLAGVSAPEAGARELPMELPGQAGVAQASDWLIGVKEPLSASEARRLGGRRLLDGRALVVPRAAARAVAAKLDGGGRLLYAEPNMRLARSSAPESSRSGWARGAVVNASLAPPSPGGAKIAVIDDFVDPTHPELAGNVSFLNTGRIAGSHGTAVASAAAAIDGNGGIFGVFPGAQILSAQPRNLSCAGVAEAVDLATEANPDVMNLSLGTTQDCVTLWIAIQTAYGSGIVVVASAGNEFEEGNPVIYPAAWPHVISVAALGRKLSPAYFSSANAAVDISAPGMSVPVAVPPAFDREDNARDGYTRADGTSFSAPMVAGAAAWIRSARSDLTQGQVADLLRYSATDIGRRGWDRDTGWGLLNVGRALTARTPEVDPLEPNDLIPEVSGALFAEPDDFIWDGSEPTSLRAAVDKVEDPVDIYRISIPGRRSAAISVTPSAGDANLEVYDGSATYVGQASRRVARSRRPGRRTDSVRIRNRAATAAVAYVAIAPYAGAFLDARYRLTIKG